MNAKQTYKAYYRAIRVSNRPDRATRLYVKRVSRPRSMALLEAIHAEIKPLPTTWLDSVVHPAMMAA